MLNIEKLDLTVGLFPNAPFTEFVFDLPSFIPGLYFLPESPLSSNSRDVLQLLAFD